MTDTRYAPPDAQVRDVAADVPDEAGVVPPDVLARIRGAWLACLISAALTFIGSIGALADSDLEAAFGLLDVAFILAMALGISRKSRVCAVLMLAWFVVSKYLVYRNTGRLGAWWWAIVLLVLYAQGIVGTFECHGRRKA